MIFILLVGFMGIMSVQSPSVFSAENIDWGKVEK
jgi:hypothetical protein